MEKNLRELKAFLRHPLAIRSLIAGFLYLLMLTRVFGLLDIEPSFLLDVTLKINPDLFFDRIAKQVAYGRDNYLLFHLIDYLFIIFFYPLLRILASRLFSGKVWPIIAVVAGVTDLLENLCIDISLLLYPQQISGFALMVSWLIPLKFLSISIVLVTAIIWLLLRKKPLGRS